MSLLQGDLFRGPVHLPEGLVYVADLFTPAQEAELVAQLAALPFQNFDFHGFKGNRRTVSFGAHYDFGSESIGAAPAIPDFLLPYLSIAAKLGHVAPDDLRHLLVTEYPPGAAIGWHRDKGVFDEVIGLSLLSSCTFRLRRRDGDKWRRASFIAEPRSGYVLSGPARSEWEHSIPAVERLRYSLTFRTLRKHDHAGTRRRR